MWEPGSTLTHSVWLFLCLLVAGGAALQPRTQKMGQEKGRGSISSLHPRCSTRRGITFFRHLWTLWDCTTKEAGIHGDGRERRFCRTNYPASCRGSGVSGRMCPPFQPLSAPYQQVWCTCSLISSQVMTSLHVVVPYFFFCLFPPSFLNRFFPPRKIELNDSFWRDKVLDYTPFSNSHPAVWEVPPISCLYFDVHLLIYTVNLYSTV